MSKAYLRVSILRLSSPGSSIGAIVPTTLLDPLTRRRTRGRTSLGLELIDYKGGRSIIGICGSRVV